MGVSLPLRFGGELRLCQRDASFGGGADDRVRMGEEKGERRGRRRRRQRR